MTLEELNTLDAPVAERALLRCCGARRWASEMAARRPFRDIPAVERDAADIWRSLDEAGWLEAFAAHPRIGDSPAADGKVGAGGADRAGAPAATGDWSAREQAGMDTASDALRQRLAAANREYEHRFGFIYIVCATGKTADEMLAIAERRLQSSREVELVTAVDEQWKITRIRLGQLIGGTSKS
jgi:OHCU decarboxylase